MSIFNNDLHGFIFYPSTHVKSPGEEFTPTREITRRHYAKHVGRIPVQFELPKKLGGTIFSSSYDKPDPLLHDQAASRLFSPTHREFSTAADQATRKYLWLEPQEPHNAYTHLHGIGSWENNVEPAMATVFHQPVTGTQLQKIGSSVGSFARQHGILLFSPHPNGFEKLLHMRIRTHDPKEKLTPHDVAGISDKIHSMFNNYFTMSPDQKVKTYTMPGRTILPDTTGHTDVLTWLPPWERDPIMRESEFFDIAQRLGGENLQAPQYWQGEGTLLGGTSPYSDEETKDMSDAQKRYLAISNYRKTLSSIAQIARNPILSAPKRLSMVRSPAKTGTIVRGINYPPGEIIPTPVQMNGSPEPTPSLKNKLLNLIRKKKQNARDDSSRFRRNRTITGTTSDNHGPPTTIDTGSATDTV